MMILTYLGYQLKIVGMTLFLEVMAIVVNLILVTVKVKAQVELIVLTVTMKTMS